MATLFNRFETQSELSKSDTATVYKALDKETGQVVALKTQELAPVGDHADAFVARLIAEGEQSRKLASQNIVLLFGAGEIDGQFSAAMEYIQGNSVATMLARKEGFSIWDLLDITRQVCAGLEAAASNDVVHSSLEPAKIMVQWDGMVKILGYGISNMSLIGAESGQGLGRLTPYCSPEQIRGEAVDLRSNLFTLGTILYEMVAGRKAFDAADHAALLGQIENAMPPSPSSLNPKIQAAVSDLIMKALAKDPASRYQHARELVDDLEKCKDSGKKAGTEVKKSSPAATVVVDPAVRAVAASKFVSAGAGGAPVASTPKSSSVAPSPVASGTRMSTPSPALAKDSKAASAAAGAGGGQRPPVKIASKADSISGAGMISDFEVMNPESHEAAGAGPESKQESPRIAVDPMMAGPVVSGPVASKSSPLMTDPMMSESALSAGSGKSFSDLAEMPPLKEPTYVPPVPEIPEPVNTIVKIYPKKDDKPRIQPREVAQKAITEISTVPPRLILYSILGAVALILVVATLVFFHVRSEDDGSTAAPRPVKAASSAKPSVPATPRPAVIETQSQPVAPIAEPEPSLAVRETEKPVARNSRRSSTPVVAPVVIPGQALVDSSPQGAQLQIDGRSDSSWLTPINLTGLTPGKHVISASKAGYSSEIRSIEVAAASKSTLLFHLKAVNALVVVNSTPVGAAIALDGKPTGKVTPAQFSVDKGAHTLLLRKQGYLDETVTTELGPAQNFQYAPTLRALGNVEDMRTMGKMNKLFGRAGETIAGMGAMSVHTQPKGAQVVINQRILDKTSPVQVMLEPGNYVVDITMTGFKPVHKVVSVDKGSKAAIDEILEHE
jgi:eukaryotic-like serine/threonine-protein kinase